MYIHKRFSRRKFVDVSLNFRTSKRQTTDRDRTESGRTSAPKPLSTIFGRMPCIKQPNAFQWAQSSGKNVLTQINNIEKETALS